jgi:hypothetical protein
LFFSAPDFFLPPALDRDHRLGVVGLAVLGGELRDRLLAVLADVFGLFEQAVLLAALVLEVGSGVVQLLIAAAIRDEEGDRQD